VAVLETRKLSKNYRRIQALREVSLRVDRGEIYGLLGQNGAGKTTLVKILLGIARNWQGEAELLGQPAGKPNARKKVGYLPEDHRFPDYHTGASLLDFYGSLLGMSRAERQRRSGEMLELVGLSERRNYKIRTYSKGMKQRIGIAQSLLHDPEVIFLDEPTDGVDPVGRREIRTIMQRLKEQGKTIFLNSHLLGEVEKICDRVGILQKGVMIREGDITTLTSQKGTFLVGLAQGQVFPEEDARKHGYVFSPRGELWEIKLEDGQSIDPLVDLLRGRGLSIRHLVEKRQTLEELFMETVEPAEPGVDGRRLRPSRPDDRIRPQLGS
jgi:ABC-2 type transport system ATP-binding protein